MRRRNWRTKSAESASVACKASTSAYALASSISASSLQQAIAAVGTAAAEVSNADPVAVCCNAGVCRVLSNRLIKGLQAPGPVYADSSHQVAMYQKDMTQYGMAQHNFVQHRMAQHIVAQHGRPRHGRAQHSTARHGPMPLVEQAFLQCSLLVQHVRLKPELKVTQGTEVHPPLQERIVPACAQPLAPEPLICQVCQQLLAAQGGLQL